jgi:hypothetical protein
MGMYFLKRKRIKYSLLRLSFSVYFKTKAFGLNPILPFDQETLEIFGIVDLL